MARRETKIVGSTHCQLLWRIEAYAGKLVTHHLFKSHKDQVRCILLQDHGFATDLLSMQKLRGFISTVVSLVQYILTGLTKGKLFLVDVKHAIARLAKAPFGPFSAG